MKVGRKYKAVTKIYDFCYGRTCKCVRNNPQETLYLFDFGLSLNAAMHDGSGNLPGKTGLWLTEWEVEPIESEEVKEILSRYEV